LKIYGPVGIYGFLGRRLASEIPFRKSAQRHFSVLRYYFINKNTKTITPLPTLPDKSNKQSFFFFERSYVKGNSPGGI
jgi:hypothetical protein